MPGRRRETRVPLFFLLSLPLSFRGNMDDGITLIQASIGCVIGAVVIFSYCAFVPTHHNPLCFLRPFSRRCKKRNSKRKMEKDKENAFKVAPFHKVNLDQSYTAYIGQTEVAFEMQRVCYSFIFHSFYVRCHSRSLNLNLNLNFRLCVSVSPSFYLCLSVRLWFCLYLSLVLFVCIAVCLSLAFTSLSVSICRCLFLSLTVSVSTCLSLCLYAFPRLPFYLCLCLCLSLALYLYVSLSRRLR